MSCAWNNYFIAVNNHIQACKAVGELGCEFAEKKDPVIKMMGEILRETGLYYWLNGMIIERDNYITLIGDDMEKNGDQWIYFMAETIRDKNMFEWLRVYMRLPFDVKEKIKAEIRKEDEEYYESRKK
jgi:hypothetical protein